MEIPVNVWERSKVIYFTKGHNKENSIPTKHQNSIPQTPNKEKSLGKRISSRAPKTLTNKNHLKRDNKQGKAKVLQTR